MLQNGGNRKREESSNFGRDDYLTEFLCDFPQFLQVNSEIVPQIMPQPTSFTFFPFRYSLILNYSTLCNKGRNGQVCQNLLRKAMAQKGLLYQ
jgi:hypothetical protein